MDSVRSEEASDVTTAIQCLYINQKYTDFSFISQDGEKEYKVHKLILAIFSPVLSDIVKNCDSYHIDTISDAALQNMIKYFYNLSPIIENIHDLRSTKTIADKFQVVQLLDICKIKLSNLPVTISDVLDILETSRELKNVSKEEECLRIIGQYKEEVLVSQKFLKLQYQRAIHILQKIKNMNLITEAVSLYYTINWLETNSMVDKNSDIIGKVDLSNILMDDFLDLIVTFPTFFSNAEIANAVKEIRHKQFEEKQKIQNNFAVLNYDTCILL